jgi:putative heme iron utilization protein
MMTRPDRPEMAESSQSNATLARTLMQEARAGALATLNADGSPFASYVTTAPSADGSPILLLSGLAAHTSNIKRDPRSSLLFVREAVEEKLAASRLTLIGRILPDVDPASRQIFLDRHPDASRYAGFSDFSFYRFHIEAGHLVAGFGRIVSLTRAALLGNVLDRGTPG